jgi:hypothetical protein
MMRPFFVYIFRFIVVLTKIGIVEELREGNVIKLRNYSFCFHADFADFRRKIS